MVRRVVVTTLQSRRLRRIPNSCLLKFFVIVYCIVGRHNCGEASVTLGGRWFGANAKFVKAETPNHSPVGVYATAQQATESPPPPPTYPRVTSIAIKVASLDPAKLDTTNNIKHGDTDASTVASLLRVPPVAINEAAKHVLRQATAQSKDGATAPRHTILGTSTPVKEISSDSDTSTTGAQVINRTEYKSLGENPYPLQWPPPPLPLVQLYPAKHQRNPNETENATSFGKTYRSLSVGVGIRGAAGDVDESVYGVAQSIPVEDYYDIEYIVRLGVGTPPQQLRFALDTGSRHSWVASVCCRNCGGTPATRFNVSASETLRIVPAEEFSAAQKFPIESPTFASAASEQAAPKSTVAEILRYGHGAVSGIWCADTMHVGSVQVPDQKLVVVDEEHSLRHGAFDGVLGVGVPVRSDPIEGFLRRLKRTGVISSETIFLRLEGSKVEQRGRSRRGFAAGYSPGAPTSHDSNSLIVLGNIRLAEKLLEDFRFQEIAHSQWWSLHSSVTVTPRGSFRRRIRDVNTFNHIVAVIDSGSSYIAVPEPDYSKLIEALIPAEARGFCWSANVIKSRFAPSGAHSPPQRGAEIGDLSSVIHCRCKAANNVLPSFEISIDGIAPYLRPGGLRVQQPIKVILTPADYLVSLSDPTRAVHPPDRICRVAFTAAPNFIPWIFGDTFLRKVDVILSSDAAFDNPIVGIRVRAESEGEVGIPSNSADPPWFSTTRSHIGLNGFYDATAFHNAFHNNSNNNTTDNKDGSTPVSGVSTTAVTDFLLAALQPRIAADMPSHENKLADSPTFNDEPRSVVTYAKRQVHDSTEQFDRDPLRIQLTKAAREIVRFSVPPECAKFAKATAGSQNSSSNACNCTSTPLHNRAAALKSNDTSTATGNTLCYTAVLVVIVASMGWLMLWLCGCSPCPFFPGNAATRFRRSSDEVYLQEPYVQLE